PFLDTAYRQGYRTAVFPTKKMGQPLLGSERRKIKATNVGLDFESGGQTAAVKIKFRARSQRIWREQERDRGEDWPAPGSEDTELGVLMGPEVDHGETKIYAGVQA
ncbi:MAG TPA: hypothetical protein VKR52_08105, partial [Terracidiphilus sp.]|nr:hypothetical protein [Terracidiphilus sp.]